MTEETRAMWDKLDRMQVQIGQHNEELAVVKHEQSAQRDMILAQSQTLAAQLSEVATKLDAISKDFHEARGGIRFGKWLGGIAVSLVGIGVAILAWWKAPG